MPIDENGQIRYANMFNDEVKQWYKLTDAARARAWLVAERLFIGDGTIEEIREYTLVPMKLLLIHIRTIWYFKHQTGGYGRECTRTVEQWAEFFKQKPKGPQAKPLTEIEIAIRNEWQLGLGYIKLAKKYNLSHSTVRSIVAKHGGVERVPAIPQFNPKGD